MVLIKNILIIIVLLIFTSAFSYTAEQIQIIATAYNKGYFRSSESVKELMNKEYYTYDDYVLAYYRYLKGWRKLSEVTGIKAKVSDKPIVISETQKNANILFTNYYKALIKNDINFFFSDIPLLSEKKDFNPVSDYSLTIDDIKLKKRLEALINYYSGIPSSFSSWKNIFLKNKDIDNDDLAEKLLVSAEYFSDYVLPSLSEGSFYSDADIKTEPELLLAIAITESKLFPSFRTESKDGNIYAFSPGITHILTDADNTYISSFHSIIGNGIKEDYSFEIIQKYYTGNKYSHLDLMTINGSFLFTSVLIKLISKIYF